MTCTQNMLVGNAVWFSTKPSVIYHKIEQSKVIGLAGPMGAGKDTVGALLSMVGYGMMAFGDGLRDEVYRHLTRDLKPSIPLDGSMNYLRDAWVALMTYPEAVYRKPTEPAARIVLQWWGTEYRRAQDPDYWVKAFSARVRPGQRVVVTDVRFQNESDWIHQRGGQVWWIDRPADDRETVGIEDHPSEKFSGVKVDRTIHNEGTLRDLAIRVREALRP